MLRFFTASCTIGEWLNPLAGSYCGYGHPQAVWNEWMDTWSAQGMALASVHVGRDYEPYAQERDRAMADFFASRNVTFKAQRQRHSGKK